MNRILIIITGSIAASRCLEIIETLNKKKFKISCIITDQAKKYINVSEIKKYSQNRVFTDRSENKNKMLHIKLSRINDLILVCPASANSIAKFANGYGDNLATNTLLASEKRIFFVPAMNSQMWANKSNQRNIEIIKNRGFEFIGPEVGNLKCGEFGIGRISETKKIIKILENNSKHFDLFRNKRCLVTAGPTLEMIDPVRYISNKSSGKQGYEIASQLLLNGAEVILISGPTNLDPPPNIKFIKIKTAKEMYENIKKISNIDFGFFAAAVTDFRNKKISNVKLKKKKSLNLNLVKNLDILENIGNSKKQRPNFVVGFAAETTGISSAKKKLKIKNCDMIVYNKINKNNPIFGSDYNKITIITDQKVKNFKKMTKVNCAKEIVKFAYNQKIIND